jgi:uridine kinase
MALNNLTPEVFSVTLYETMPRINPGIAEMALYEFRYALHNLVPDGGWAAVELEAPETIEQRVNNRAFYDGIQIKPRLGDRIVLDENVLRLTRMLLVGLVTGEYAVQWVNGHFFFDIRGFYFLHRTHYFTASVLAHLGGRPFRQFEQKQKAFDGVQDVGYKAFQAANAEVDACFIESVQKLIAAKGTPILLAIAGPTAAGKTEIVERLREAFEQEGRKTTSIELDNFLTDRDYREAKGIFTQGKQALHFELFQQSLKDICQGKKIAIPRYDFVYATSSHDLQGNLKPGCTPIEIEPADVIFIEGNFPFLIEETVHLIGIKVVYLTDDAVRMKRKWKRDIDYRKKYEPTYFRNRYFKDQFIMAEIAYRPQMETCDMVVDTTGAALWTTPEIAEILTRPSQEDLTTKDTKEHKGKTKKKPS